MKIVSIIAVSLLVAALQGHAQPKTKTVSRVDHDDPYAIPGKDLGLGFTVPPIIFDDSPTPDPSYFEDDISIEILPDSTGISHTICPDKFIVYYHVRVNSAQPLANGHIAVKVSTGLDGVPDQVKQLNYRDNGDNTVRGSFIIPCRFIPLAVRGQGIVRSFYIQPYSITAVTMGGYIGSGRSLTLILDADKRNNSASSMQLKTLMPPICTVTHFPKNTK